MGSDSDDTARDSSFVTVRRDKRSQRTGDKVAPKDVAPMDVAATDVVPRECTRGRVYTDRVAMQPETNDCFVATDRRGKHLL